MADLLSSATLLLTVLTILYSLWYPEIVASTRLPGSKFSVNRKLPHKDARRVLLFKSLPLLVGSLVLFAATLPKSILIIRLPLAKSLEEYDGVSTIFVAITGVLFFLGCHTLVAAFNLGLHVWRLNPKRGDYKVDL